MTYLPVAQTLAPLQTNRRRNTLFAKSKEPGWSALCEADGQAVVAKLWRSPEGMISLSKLERTAAKSGLNADLLGSLRKEHDLQHCRCMTLLPLGSYRFLHVEQPDVPPEELAEAMRWKIKDQLDYPVEQATIQALPIPDDHMPSRLHMAYAIAARTDTVQELVQRYQKAGVALEVIDVMELAQRNLATLYEEPGRGLAMLSITAGGGLLTFTSNGELFALRQIDLPLNSLGEADATRRAELLDRLVLELQRSLDNFDRQHGHIPISRLVLLPMPGADELQRYLSDNLYLPVISADLNEVLDASAVPDFADPAVQNQGLFAIGLALREAGAA